MNERPSAQTKDAVPRVGVGVLLVDTQKRVLLTLRRRAPEAGCWSIVGGKVDFLERLEHCAVREAREEAGVDVELVRLLCVTDHVLPNEEQHWVAPAYLGRIVSGNARNCEPDKTREVRWFEIGSIPQNLTMTARNAIGAYLRERHVVEGCPPPAQTTNRPRNGVGLEGQLKVPQRANWP